MKRKIEAMYSMFGIDHAHKCKECKNFDGSPNSYKKCSAYGHTASASSDWNSSFVACGLFNKDYTGDVPVIRTLKAETEEEQIAGQLNLFDYIES